MEPNDATTEAEPIPWRYLGEYIRWRRAELHMTQASLADTLGIERSYLSKIESGHIRRPASQYTKLATALDVDPNVIGRILIETADVDEPEEPRRVSNVRTITAPLKRIRCNFNSTVKEGWRYEGTVELEWSGPDDEAAMILDQLDTILQARGELGVARRNSRSEASE